MSRFSGIKAGFDFAIVASNSTRNSKEFVSSVRYRADADGMSKHHTVGVRVADFGEWRSKLDGELTRNSPPSRATRPVRTCTARLERPFKRLHAECAMKFTPGRKVVLQ